MGSVHHLAVVIRRVNTDLVEPTAVPVSRDHHLEDSLNRLLIYTDPST
jgi:hypothetical protein